MLIVDPYFALKNYDIKFLFTCQLSMCH